MFESPRRGSSELVRSGLIDTNALAGIPPLLTHKDDKSFSLDAAPTFSIPLLAKHRLVALIDGRGVAAEKLRILGTRLKYLGQRQSIRKVLITSTIQNEGKSLVSANLAITLALQQHKTLLIDGDLHKPSLGVLLDAAGRPGLGDWWERRNEIGEFLYRAEGLPLWFLPPGKLLDRPLTMLQSADMLQLVARIAGWFDWIIIDSPPLAPLADAASWATMADGVILVARYGVTPKNLVRKSLESLDKSKILGIVLNGSDTKEQQYYRGYYQAPTFTPAQVDRIKSSQAALPPHA